MDGEPGIRQILQNLTQLKNYYGALPVIRSAALSVAGSRQDNDQAGQVTRLADFVRRAVKYQADPYNAELTQTPDVMLLAIHARGYVPGDCDDHCLLFASLCESLGVACDIVGVMMDSPVWNHVICTAYPDGNATDIDLCAKQGQQPEYPAQLRV